MAVHLTTSTDTSGAVRATGRKAAADAGAPAVFAAEFMGGPADS
jgi:hypothetical protein